MELYPLSFDEEIPFNSVKISFFITSFSTHFSHENKRAGSWRLEKWNIYLSINNYFMEIGYKMGLIDK